MNIEQAKLMSHAGRHFIKTSPIRTCGFNKHCEVLLSYSDRILGNYIEAFSKIIVELFASG